MYGALPLDDCTRDIIQSMNRHAGASNGSSATKPSALKRHNPYAMKLLAPEDSVELHSSILSSPLSSRPSPLNWEARAFEPSGLYSNVSTPYIGQSFASLPMDPQVRRSLFGDSPTVNSVNAAPESTELALAAATANTNTRIVPPPPQKSSCGGSPLVTSAKKAIAKIYVGGRPVVVPRYDNEVTVQLRSGEATFAIADMSSLLAAGEEAREMVGLAVVVEGDRGEDLGTITAVLRAESNSPAKSEDEKEKSSTPSAKAVPRVLRVATLSELRQYDALPQLEAEALAYCHACLSEVKFAVPISVESVVYQFDRKKLTVRYTSEAYVDFNDLTRMLHKKFNCRIWMDQLNRDAVNTTDKRTRRGEHGGRKGGNSGNNQRKGTQKRKD